MLTRRRLLSVAVAGAGASLAGCTGPSPVVWLPWASPSPLPIADAAGGAARCADLAAAARAVLGHAQAWSLTAGQTQRLTWLAETAALHASVLASADPVRRQVGTAPTAPAAPPPATAAAAWRWLGDRFTGAATDFTARARATDATAALLWAGLAAFTAASADGLPRLAFTAGTDEHRTTPELGSADWLEPMLQRSREAAYGLETVLAAPKLVKADRTVVRRQLAAWQSLGAALVTELRTRGRTVPPAPAAYPVPVPGDRRAAWRLGADLQSRLLPQLGAWAANAPDQRQRDWAITALIAGTRGVVAFGGTLPRWPGWAG